MNVLLKKFNEQLKINNKKLAVISNNKNITFYKLNELSSKICTKLKGSGYEIFGIIADSTIEHFILMIACIKAEIPFINIDNSVPLPYNNSIIERLKIQVLLASKHNKAGINFHVHKIYDVQDLLDNEINNISKQAELDNTNQTLYFVVTSGTTGKAKIVRRNLKALYNSYLQIGNNLPYLVKTERASFFCSLNFAFGLDQAIILLFYGITIDVHNVGDLINVKEIFNLLSKQISETVLFPVPIIKLLSKHPEFYTSIPENLRYVIVGGEPLVISANLIFEFHKRNILLINNYGATEIGTMFFSPMSIELSDVKEYNRVPIGIPLNGFKALLLNENGEETDKGELHIVTDKFFNDYYENNIRLIGKVYCSSKYKGMEIFNTEDYCERRNGVIFILGRIDNLVNISGYRVGIEEVEGFLSRIITRGNFCVVNEKNIYEENRLACLYTDKSTNILEVMKRCNEIMPHYMIPTRFLHMDELTFNRNGKINRDEMRRKMKNSSVPELEEQNGTIEGKLQSMLENMLRVRLSSDSLKVSFKEIGVDSLLYTDFISLVEDKFAIRIEEKEIFDNAIDSIQKLAEYIKTKKDADNE